MRVAFCSSEMAPLVKTGGLGDVSGALPISLQKLGIEVNVFLPRYKFIDYEVHQIVNITDEISQATLGKNIKVYLIEHKEYFLRDGLYGDGLRDYKDNLERFQFFCLKILETLRIMNVPVDIIHCHDWQTALIPVYLRAQYRSDAFFKNIKTVLTIHNLSFQGIFPREQYEKLGLNEGFFPEGKFEFFDRMNLLKAGILDSDRVTTVSSQYAKEIKTREFGCGLDGVIRDLPGDVIGIVNGIDYEAWDPFQDKLIKKNYSSRDFMEGKRANKEYLQQELGLELTDKPLFGVVTRLSHQKGIELILDTWDQLSSDAQLVIQGVGDKTYEERIKKYVKDKPKNIAFLSYFDDRMARQIYAGSDMFLMPSCFEPCGLSQMISFRYGTIPIVFKTGGLMDTVIPFEDTVAQSNGFMFDQYTKDDFVRIVKKAIQAYYDKKIFRGLIENAFKSDFSSEKSARQYKDMYECLLSA